MRARIVRNRQWLALATSAALSYAAGIASIGADAERWYFHAPGRDWRETYRQADAIASTWTIGVVAAFVVAALLPWVLLFRRSPARDVRLREGGVSVGDQAFAATEVTGASVAPDGPGFSVALGRGSAATFLEVDRLEDARSIVTALGRRFPGDGSLRLTLPRHSVALVIAVFSVIDVAYALLVPLYASWWFNLRPLWAGGVIVSLLALWLVLGRARDPLRLSWSASEPAEETARRLGGSPLERHARRHLTSLLRADPAPPRLRVDLLERQDDATAAWLARIDALRADGGYRGESIPREALWQLLRGDASAIDVRLAAARLLRVRDGEEADEIAAASTDDEVRARIAAVVTDASDEAAERLEAIGPLFRTR